MFLSKRAAAFAAISVTLLVGFVPTSSEAVIGKRPYYPLSTIKDFHPDWVEVYIHRGFNTKSPEHVERSTQVADFVCKLYNRTAVLLLLSQPNGLRLIDDQGRVKAGHLDLYYTFACAIE